MKEILILVTPFLTALIGGMFTLMAAKENTNSKRVVSIVFTIVIVGLLTATYITWKPIDPFDAWISDVKKNYNDVQGSDYIRLKTAVKNNPPPHHGSSQSDKYFRDVQVGKLLMQEQEFAEILQIKFGISSDSFTGMGLSVPWDQDYKKSSSREYLVKNINETDDDVWTWILDPAFTSYDKKISELFEILPTENSNTQNLTNHIATIDKRMKNIKGIAPVIRFQKFPLSSYKGTVGRKESDYVFFSNLHDVYDLSIEEAAEASGYRLSNSGSDDSDTKLFVWLYVPTHAQSSRKATWGNVLEILQE